MILFIWINIKIL